MHSGFARRQMERSIPEWFGMLDQPCLKNGLERWEMNYELARLDVMSFLISHAGHGMVIKTMQAIRDERFTYYGYCGFGDVQQKLEQRIDGYGRHQISFVNTA